MCWIGAWARPEVGRGLRAKLVRYADDLVVLCAREVEPSLTKLRQLLGSLGLSLNEEKTQRVNAWEQSFDFLGFSFGMKQGRTRGEMVPSRRAVPQVHSAISGTSDTADDSPAHPNPAAPGGGDAQPVCPRLGPVFPLPQ